MVRLNRGCWVLVADGEKALIMENRGSAVEPRLTIRGRQAISNPPDREQSTDRSGRVNDGPSVQRSAMQETDRHEFEKQRFVSDIAQFLYEQAHRGALDEIVLVAAPQVLGQIRAQLHAEVAEKVIGEIPKFLTNHATDVILKQVTEHLAETA